MKRGEYNKWMKDGAPIPATTVRDMKKARKEQVSLEPYSDDSYQHTNCNQPEHPQLRPLSSFDWDSEYLLNINGPNNSEAEKGSAEEDEEDEEDEDEDAFDDEPEGEKKEEEEPKENGNSGTRGLFQYLPDNGKDKLFPGSQVTINEAFVMALQFTLKHTLADAVLDDFTKMTNLMLPENHNFAQSKYLFQKFFKELDQVLPPFNRNRSMRKLQGKF